MNDLTVNELPLATSRYHLQAGKVTGPLIIVEVLESKKLETTVLEHVDNLKDNRHGLL